MTNHYNIKKGAEENSYVMTFDGAECGEIEERQYGVYFKPIGAFCSKDDDFRHIGSFDLAALLGEMRDSIGRRIQGAYHSGRVIKDDELEGAPANSDALFALSTLSSIAGQFTSAGISISRNEGRVHDYYAWFHDDHMKDFRGDWLTLYLRTDGSPWVMVDDMIADSGKLYAVIGYCAIHEIECVCLSEC